MSSKEDFAFRIDENCQKLHGMTSLPKRIFPGHSLKIFFWRFDLAHNIPEMNLFLGISDNGLLFVDINHGTTA